MSDRFGIRFALGSPVIVTSYYTLDALLAALLFEATRDLQIAHEQIPLASSEGVWHGSQAYVEMNPEPVNRSAVFTASLRASHDVPSHSILAERKGQIPQVGAGYAVNGGTSRADI